MLYVVAAKSVFRSIVVFRTGPVHGSGFAYAITFLLSKISIVLFSACLHLIFQKVASYRHERHVAEYAVAVQVAAVLAVHVRLSTRALDGIYQVLQIHRLDACRWSWGRSVYAAGFCACRGQ